MVNRQTAQRSISIVGLGNWGSSLAHALLAAGISLAEVISPRGARGRSASERRARKLPHAALTAARLNADIFWLCVPDAVIPAVTRSLVLQAASKQVSLRQKLIVHSSGALTSEVLTEAAQAGATVASVHPFMSFPTHAPVDLQGVPFGVEANAAGRRTLYPIIRRMGANPFPVAARNKAFYHIAGMLASPLLLGHMTAALQSAEFAGFTPKKARALLEPIVRVTLDNFFRQGGQASFSGPIARGDVETIRLHLRALEPHPMLADVYRSSALAALELLEVQKQAGATEQKLRQLLRRR